MDDKPKSGRRKHKKGQCNKNVTATKESNVSQPSSSCVGLNQPAVDCRLVADSPLTTTAQKVITGKVNKQTVGSQQQIKINPGKINPTDRHNDGSLNEKSGNVSNVPRIELTLQKPVGNAISNNLTTEPVKSNAGKKSVNDSEIIAMPSNSKPPLVENKSKAELRAERRALQDAQRAAKALQKNGTSHNADGNAASLRPRVNSEGKETQLNAEKKLVAELEQPDGSKVINSMITETPTKSKGELRAERRALQEAQRAAKGMKIDEKNVSTSASKDIPPVKSVKLAPEKKPLSNVDKHLVKKPATILKQVKLVSHLPQYRHQISVMKAAERKVHPAIIKLGLQYASGDICGSNSRSVNFIQALVKVIRDFKMPENKDFSVAIYSLCIEPVVEFLEKCRPISVGMRNVCKMLRDEISNIPKDVSDDEVKRKLIEALNSFLENHIFKAHDSIVNLAKDKITSKDVIVTYGCSYIVKRVLKAAHENSKFRVIVVDGRPKLEGINMLRYLVENGIECTYVLINALAHVMPEATKVILGAHALLANGCVMSRVGSSQVALVAKAFNKPVLVCCETYKFCDMVQTDSFVINELGDPDDLVETHRRNNPLSEWKAANTLNILNLYYDVTPPDLVTVLINEGYVVPCTSVPVVLRVRPKKS